MPRLKFMLNVQMPEMEICEAWEGHPYCWTLY